MVPFLIAILSILAANNPKCGGAQECVALAKQPMIDTHGPAHAYWVVANEASYELQFSNAFRHLVLFVFDVQSASLLVKVTF